MARISLHTGLLRNGLRKGRTGQAVAACLMGLGLFGPATAYAVSCDEIVNMVTLNIPENIIVETMKNSGKVFTEQDVQCLQSNRAPAGVVGTAQSMSAQRTAVAAPVPGGPAPAPAPVSRFESEETLGGGSFEAGGAEEGDEPTGGGPAELEQAIEFYRARKYLTSSNELYAMLRDNRYPDQETKVQYYLGKSLQGLDMLHSAQHYYMQVVRKGPSNPYFKYALPKLIDIAVATGNDYELLRIVTKIPPEAFPRAKRNHLFYLVGRKQFERDELSEAAESFQQVSTKNDMFMRAKYYEGVINQQKGKLKSAVQAFVEVSTAAPPPTTSVLQARQVEDLKDLALINIARIYYGLERYENAESFYKQVDRDSTYWAESLFERAWTSFLSRDVNQALGLLLTVESPYYSDVEFIPEVTYLRALAFFNLCEFNEVERTLVKFDARYQPMQTEIENYLTQFSGNKDLWDQAYDQYFSSRHDASVLTPAFFSRMLRNRDLAAMVSHLDMMDSEVDRINEQKSQWRDTVGASLLTVIEEDRVQYKKKAGNELLREMLKVNSMLKELLTRSEIVRFEVVDAQAEDYAFRAGTVDLGAGERRRIDYSGATGEIYWPFNGEFWRDELGYYQYTEHGSCK